MLLDLLMSLTWAVMFIESPREILYHNWFSLEDNRQAYVHYAYDIWGLEFVKMIECENGTRNPYIVSKTKDYWLCQLNFRYNKDFILSEDYYNVFSQIDYCYAKWKINPKLWYWPDRKIHWQKCTDYVSQRFYFQYI